MTYIIQLRRDVAADWTSVNPILHEGELGLELDTDKFKFGDGVTPWNDLEYNESLPDATGLPDGKFLATVGEEWVVVDSPISPDELPTAVGQPDGKVLTIVDEAWIVGDAAAPGDTNTDTRVYPGGVNGALVMATGTTRIYNDTGRTLTILNVRSSVGTAPVGASVVVDVNKNGTSIFPTGTKPTITSGGVTDKRVPDTTSFADGDYLTVDVDNIGSTTPGSNLNVQIEVTG